MSGQLLLNRKPGDLPDFITLAIATFAAIFTFLQVPGKQLVLKSPSSANNDSNNSLKNMKGIPMPRQLLIVLKSYYMGKCGC